MEFGIVSPGGIVLAIPKVMGTSIKVAICDWYELPWKMLPTGPDVHSKSLLKYVPADIASDQRKIGFVRDPWSRLVSAYRNKVNPRYQERVVRKHGILPETTFSEFIEIISEEDCHNSHWEECHSWYQHANTVVLFEDITQWWEYNFVPMGAPPLPSYNKTGASDMWREYYTPELFNLVGAMYPNDAAYYPELTL